MIWGQQKTKEKLAEDTGDGQSQGSYRVQEWVQGTHSSTVRSEGGNGLELSFHVISHTPPEMYTVTSDCRL